MPVVAGVASDGIAFQPPDLSKITGNRTDSFICAKYDCLRRWMCRFVPLHDTTNISVRVLMLLSFTAMLYWELAQSSIPPSDFTSSDAAYLCINTRVRF